MVKDHTLDDKIIASATNEFLSLGFQKASLHKIAENAGITTGALYTRYKNKDALFVSLVKDMLSEIGEEAESIQNLYKKAEAGDPSSILDVIRQEENTYLKLMFRHYDACVLLFCRSGGSSLEIEINRMMRKKAEETVLYLERISKKPTDLDGIELIMMEQFHFFKHILEQGYDLDRAFSCMKRVEKFMEAGWKDLFEEIM